MDMQDVFWGTMTFVGGAVATAIVGAGVHRLFDRARLQFAVTRLATARTQNREFQVIPMTSELRRLLGDVDIEGLETGTNAFAEVTLDSATLFVIEQEAKGKIISAQLSAYISQLSSREVKEIAYDLALDYPVLNEVKSALATSAAAIPNVPTRDKFTQPAVYPLIFHQDEKEGRKRELVLIDLPGALSPQVGDRLGRDWVNVKIWPLMYALSSCDAAVLRQCLKRTVDYASARTLVYAKVRRVLELIKNEERYLEIRLLVTNLGRESAFLSEQMKLQAADGQLNLELFYREYVEGSKEVPWSIQLRDIALRVQQTYHIHPDLFANYSSAVARIAVAPGETVALAFVSNRSLTDPERQAVDAIRTGFIACTVQLTKYLPRNVRWFKKNARYKRIVEQTQKLSRL